MNLNVLLKSFGDSWIRKFVNLPTVGNQIERKRFMNLVIDLSCEIAKGVK